MKLPFTHQTDTTDTKEAAPKLKYVRPSFMSNVVIVISAGLAVLYDNTGAWLQFDRPVISKVFLTLLVTITLIALIIVSFRRKQYLDQSGKYNLPAVLGMVGVFIGSAWIAIKLFTVPATQHEAALVMFVGVIIAYNIWLYRFKMVAVPDHIYDDVEPADQDEPTQAAA